MSEAKHTELPWIIKAIPAGCEIWDTVQRRLIATLDIETAVLSQANAELIVRAVNSHDALMEACERAIKVAGRMEISKFAEITSIEYRIETIEYFKQTLAKAKGES